MRLPRAPAVNPRPLLHTRLPLPLQPICATGGLSSVRSREWSWRRAASHEVMHDASCVDFLLGVPCGPRALRARKLAQWTTPGTASPSKTSGVVVTPSERDLDESLGNPDWIAPAGMIVQSRKVTRPFPP